MKNFKIILCLTLLIGLISCSSTKNKSGDTPVEAVKKTNYISLADYLRQNTNVDIKGEGPTTRLQIRGINSIMGDTRPFIYINKMPIGRDYNRANNNINPNNITRVEVISSLSQLAIYGEDGNSGIIKIHTKDDMGG